MDHVAKRSLRWRDGLEDMVCGRYASTRSAADLASLFSASDATGEESLAASFNVAPTDPVHVVRRRPGQVSRRFVEVARWGLLPPWARASRDGARMINARAETLPRSRAYRGPFARRRCLVPADGWYEWLPLAADRPGGTNKPGGAKQAYYLTPRDGGVLAFAGLWEMWRPEPAADPLLTVSVVTTAAVGDLRIVHDRMPLVLTPDRWPDWLGDSGPVDAGRLLAPPGPHQAAAIELRQVGPAVGNVRNDSEQLIQSVTGSALGVEPTQTVDLTLF